MICGELSTGRAETGIADREFEILEVGSGKVKNLGFGFGDLGLRIQVRGFGVGVSGS